MIKQEKQKLERLPLCSDYVFKRVFAKEGNESLLKDLLEAILEIQIESLEIQNAELPKETKENKLGVLDIKVKINDDTIIDVEMQITNEHNMEERTTTYMGKLISNQLNKGESYKKLKKCVLINILNFEYYKRNSYHSIAHMKFENTNKKTYVDMGYKKEEEIASKKVELHFIEIPKFKKKNPNAHTKLEQWLWLLVGEGEKIKMAEEKNKEVKKAVEVLDEMSMDRAERERYEAILKAEFNYNTSMYNMKEEGKREKQIEIAKKLLELNVDIETIIKATKLTEEEINKINSKKYRFKR